MNKFKFSNYKLPHMAPITLKKTDPTPSHEERQLAAARERLQAIAKKSTKQPIEIKMEAPINFGHNRVNPFAPEEKVPSFQETFMNSSGGGNDLDEFLKRIESRKITNPEYSDQKGPKQSKSYDFFITNRSPESDKVARQMDSLNKAVIKQAKNRQFDEMRKTREYQQNLMDQYNLD